MCTIERDLQIKLEDKIDVENFVDYVEDYFQLTSSDEQKVTREQYKYFKKQTYDRQQLLVRIHSACLFPSTSMAYLPPLSSIVTRKKNTNASATIIFLFIFLRKPNIVQVTPNMKHSNGTVSTSNGYLVCIS